jgi:hypothetical protein
MQAPDFRIGRARVRPAARELIIDDEIADALSLLAALCDRFEDAARLAGFADRVNKERGSDARDDASEMSRQRVGRILQQRVAADRLPMLKEQGGSLDIDRAVALALQAEPT